MLTLSQFDLAFIANARKRLVPITAAIDGTLYDLSGSAYLSGSYDIFLEYANDSCPTNGGYGWNGEWICEARETRKVISEDILLKDSASFIYPSGSNVSGSDWGYGWRGPWNVLEGL